MAITYVNKGAYNYASGSNLTLALPASIAENDILLILLECDNGDAAPSNPTGYTLKYNNTHTNTRNMVYWKRATSSESNPTFTWSGGMLSGGIVAFRGCLSSGDPFDASAINTLYSASWTFTGITTTVAGAMVIASGSAAADRTSNNDWAETGLVSITQALTGNSGSSGLHSAYGIKTTAGATGDITMSVNTVTYAALLTFSLKPETALSINKFETVATDSLNVTVNRNAATTRTISKFETVATDSLNVTRRINPYSISKFETVATDSTNRTLTLITGIRTVNVFDAKTVTDVPSIKIPTLKINKFESVSVTEDRTVLRNVVGILSINKFETVTTDSTNRTVNRNAATTRTISKFETVATDSLNVTVNRNAATTRTISKFETVSTNSLNATVKPLTLKIDKSESVTTNSINSVLRVNPLKINTSESVTTNSTNSSTYLPISTDITFVNQGAYNSVNGTNLTLALPSGIAEDDILVLLLECDNAYSAPSVSGYTLKYEHTQNNTRMMVYWKRASASESNPTITWSTAYLSGGIMAFRRCVASGDPFDSANATNAKYSSLMEFTSITTTIAGAMVICACSNAADRTSNNDWTETGLVSITQGISGNSGASALHSAYGRKTTAGATGDVTMTVSGTTYAALITCALRPDLSLSISKYEEVNTNSLNVTVNRNAATTRTISKFETVATDSTNRTLTLITGIRTVNKFESTTVTDVPVTKITRLLINKFESVAVTEDKTLIRNVAGAFSINEYEQITTNSTNSTVSVPAVGARLINVFDAKTVTDVPSFRGTLRINTYEQTTTTDILTWMMFSGTKSINTYESVSIEEFLTFPPEPPTFGKTEITEIEVGNIYPGLPIGNTPLHTKSLRITCDHTASPDTDWWAIYFINMLVRDENGNEKILHRGLDYSAYPISGNLQASGVNGLDTGSPRTAGDATYTRVFYYLYIIFNETTRTVASLASLAVGKPTLPDGYNFYRRVGVMAYYNPNSSWHYAYSSTQYDDYFFYTQESNILGEVTSAGWNQVDTNRLPACIRKVVVAYGTTTTNRGLGVSVESGGVGSEILRSQYTTATTGYFGSVFSFNSVELGTFEIPVKISTIEGGGGASDAFVTFYYYVDGTETMYMNCIGWYDDLALYY